MKQVKSLVLAVFLIFALDAGARGGDIGNPGIRTTTTGEIGNPTAKSTLLVDPVTTTSQTETTTIGEISDLLFGEMMLALYALI